MADWPRAFNLISGGPSRQYLTNADLIDGAPTASVNRAIDVKDRGICIDFAMFADGPESIVNELGLGKYLVPPIQIWIPRAAFFHQAGAVQILDLATRWEPYLPMSVGFRVTPFGVVGGLDGKLRHQFGALAALERMMLFKPSRIRILCADMMGPWINGKTEQECEMLQSHLEQCQRDLGSAQRRLNASGGKDKAAEVMRDNLQIEVDAIIKSGDPQKFKRWEHERNALKVFAERAGKAGCEVEFKTPMQAVMA